MVLFPHHRLVAVGGGLAQGSARVEAGHVKLEREARLVSVYSSVEVPR